MFVFVRLVFAADVQPTACGWQEKVITAAQRFSVPAS